MHKEAGCLEEEWNKMAGEKGKDRKQEFISQAINDGIDEILKIHPAFSENREYITRHIDGKKLNSEINEIYSAVRSKKWDDKKKFDYMHKAIANSVASGKLFDEEGQEIVLKKSLEEKALGGFFRGLFARRELEGERELDDTIGAFKNLYHLFKQGGYAERMPEISGAVEKVYNLGILNPALDILKYYNLIGEKKYRELKRNVKEETMKNTKKVVTGLENYLTPQKEAAAVLLVLGIVLTIFSGIKFTGAVINSLNTGTCFIGILCLIFGLILFFIKSKKNK